MVEENEIERPTQRLLVIQKKIMHNKLSNKQSKWREKCVGNCLVSKVLTKKKENILKERKYITWGGR